MKSREDVLRGNGRVRVEGESWHCGRAFLFSRGRTLEIAAIVDEYQEWADEALQDVRWKRLFSQIELLSKPTNDFREQRLAGIIDLWPLTD
jgi:hypothetical protein